jgi:hypothetical protein
MHMHGYLQLHILSDTLGGSDNSVPCHLAMQSVILFSTMHGHKISPLVGMSTTRPFFLTASDKKLSLPVYTRDDGIITFHGLCDNCERSFHSWDVVGAVQSCSAQQGHACELIPLCTVGHLSQVFRKCHLCALFLRASKLFPNKNVKGRSDTRVYLHAVEGDDCVVLQVSLGSKTLPEGGKKKDGAVFSLRRISCMKSLFIIHECCN